jgi:general secretion pathway protein B
VSYILEALKKLEQKRQRERMPDLLTIQEEVSPVNKKRPLWPFITVGLILLNAIFVFLLLRDAPWINSVQPPAHQSRVNRESAEPAPSPAVEKKKEQQAPEVKKDEPPPGQKDVIRSTPSQSQVPVPKKSLPAQSPSKTEVVQQAPLVKTKDEALPKIIKPSQPRGTIVSIKELPADIKASLPELKMTVHSYNEQIQTRFVIINNGIYREGQSITVDLKVEQITQNGAIFNYQGHRFLLRINESL